MGIASDYYKKIDRSLGGYLPGGVTPQMAQGKPAYTFTVSKPPEPSKLPPINIVDLLPPGTVTGKGVPPGFTSGGGGRSVPGIPPGTPVGTGIGGGTLVTTEGGGTIEVPQSIPPSTYSVGQQSTQQNLILTGQGRLGTEQRGTSITTAPSFNAKVFISPTLYREQQGSFIDDETRKRIILNSDVQYADINTRRAATSDERKQFEEFERSQREEVAGTAPPLILRKYGEIKGIIQQDITEADIGGSKFLSQFGVNDKNIEKLSNIVSYGSLISYAIPGGREFIKGTTESVLKEVAEKPFSNVALFGLAYGAGLVLEGVPLLLKAGLTRTGLTKSAEIAPKILKFTELSIGAGLTGQYAISTGERLLQKDISAEERGEIFGTAVTEAAIVGYGVSKGIKGAKQIEGFIATRGRTEIDIPQGEYPTAPTKKQLELFEKNIYPELSERPGAFHTTPNRFVEESITAGMGSSELPGLYGSTKISTPFAKIPGSSSSGIRDVETLINELLRVNKPGVAYLVPEGFRYSPAYKIPGIPKVPLGYAFEKKAIPGFADIPNIKSEIEAVFRPKAFNKDVGELILTQQKYYVNIKGIRVPLDVFEYEKLSSDLIKDLGGGTKSKFKSGDYSEPSYRSVVPEYSLIYDKSPNYLSASKSLSYSGSSSVSQFSTSISSDVSSLSNSLSKSISSSSSSSSVSQFSTSISSDVSSLSNSLSKSLSYSGRSFSPISSGSYLNKLKGEKRKRRIAKLRQAYSVLLKRRGKYVPVATGLPRGLALKKLEGDLFNELSRSGKILQSGTTELEDIAFKPSEKQFRQYRVRKGRRIETPDSYIQKISANLKTQSEKGLIQQARRQKQRQPMNVFTNL